MTDEDDMFPAEYAEVYGVPFSFIPVGPVISTPAAQEGDPGAGAAGAHRLRDHLPALTGYRYELAGEKLHVEFDESAGMSLSDAPTCRPRSRSSRSSG